MPAVPRTANLKVVRSKLTSRPINIWPRHIDRTTTRFTKLFLHETNDSVWSLVDRLRYTSTLYPLTVARVRHGLSFEEYYERKPAVHARDLDAAVSVLRKQGFVTTESDVAEKRPLPTWLVLQVVAQKVRTRAQAQGPLLDLVFSHLPVVPVQLQPPLLVMATISLAKFGILSPLRRIVQTFLNIPLSHPSLHFNTFLHAITRFPRSLEAANQVVVLLQAMKSRQLHLRPATYRALLSDRFVTLQLTKVLRTWMISQGFVPTAADLEANLRIFAQHGIIHDAKQYLHAIRELAIKDGPPHILSGSNPPEPSEAASVQRANTLYLSAFREDSSSAFRYLAGLLNVQKMKKPTSPTSPLEKVRSHVPRFISHPCKKSIDIYDWTTVLSVAARDPKTSAKTLLRLFDQADKNTAAFRPNVVTYTVLLRGLYRRMAFPEAERLWHRLREQGYVLDRKALTIGLQILTRSGKPHEAFALLEELAVRPDTPMLVPWRLQSKSERQKQGRIPMNIIAMNEFMVSLMRIGRPDIVFKLWDSMETLYGLTPDVLSLNILLGSARSAARLDDSLSGALSELALKNPFRKPTTKPLKREEIIHSLTQVLGDEQLGLQSYSSGIWNDAPGWRGGIRTFRQVILGNWPELRHIHPPANATLPPGNAGAFHPLTELAQGSVVPYSHDDTVPESHSAPMYPQIVPLESTFFRYIQLLGTISLASEIPLTLAWMRRLNIVPATKTLSISLVFWAEVSLRGPLVEKWAGNRSEYAKLVNWMIDWVGEKHVPKDYHIAYWLRTVARMRATRS